MIGNNNCLYIGLYKPLPKLSYEIEHNCALSVDQHYYCEDTNYYDPSYYKDDTNYCKIVFSTDLDLLEPYNSVFINEMGDMKYIYDIYAPTWFHFDMTDPFYKDGFDKWFFEWLIGIN